MKFLNHFKVLILLLVTVFIVTSCENNDKFVFTHKVMVNNGLEFVSVNAEARTIELQINSLDECEIIGEADWFTLDKSKIGTGKSILTLKLKENDGKPRHQKIQFVNEELAQPLLIQQNAANTSYEDVTHNFYVTVGTMPSLYAGLKLLSEEIPSYFFFERTNTYDISQFPSHTKYISTGYTDMQPQMVQEMRQHIMNINRTEPNAIFGITVDDIRSRVSYDWFVAQGIDSSRVKVTLVTDGTGSYNNFWEYFGDASKGESNWKEYQKEVENLNWDAHTTKMYPSKGVDDTFLSPRWAAHMSTLSGYRYILQDSNLLETNSPFVRERLENDMNTISLPPVNILNSLSPEKQDQFRRMAKFDSETINTMFKESPKKNLIIISTNPSSSIMQYINETINQYSDEYDIFISVHPADPDSDMLEALEREGKAKLFPKGLPFEVLLWSFMDDIDAIGGSQSTVFLTVPPAKVKFMYARNAEEMVKPLNLLMKDQPEINWMIK